ncbi:MAG TPA: protein kinase [Myxococcales bacterium]|jgi:tetratricopeptide (TPR) repeat protein|nr:protein kinase [Myxococcales bacterium]
MNGAVLIDRYVLGALLGRGGMGYVHEAVDLKLRRAVAVKLLGSATPDSESLRRFSREALAAGSLSHPNVVGVFDTGEEAGRPFLVTELLRGETLRQVLQRGKPELPLARSWAKQLAAGLLAAHEKGLIHRDLKPSNIFITSDGWVKILDFGLARLKGSREEQRRMEGTIGYMAPEQVRGLPVDARADLFNFGLVLHEMLSGKRAFSDGSDTETSYAIVLREPAPLPASVPRELRQLVSSCLAKDREQRPASAKEVLDRLRPRLAAPARLRTWGLPLLALSLLALSVLALAWRRHDGFPSAAPAGTVAIFPFEARTAQGLVPLADGVSDLLARDLDDTALHPALPDRVRKAHFRGTAGNLDRARAAGLGLNARYFVLGRVEERGGELLLEAVLHDTESARPRRRASAHGPPSAILRLVRQLSDQLQEKPLPQAAFEARLSALQEKFTASFPALQAFLESEYFQNEGQYEKQAAAVKLALQLDPEFAFALYRWGRLSWQTDLNAAEEAMRHAARLGSRLTPLQRAVARTFMLRASGERMASERLQFDAVRERPGDAEAWLMLGSYLRSRDGALMGHSPQEAVNAFQRMYELDPRDSTPLEYLVMLAELRGERTVVASLVDRLLALNLDESDTAAWRLSRAWARGDQREHDEAFELLKRNIPARTFPGVVCNFATRMDGSPDASIVAAMAPAQAGLQTKAVAHLLNGQIEAARQDVTAAIPANPGFDTAFYLPWIDTLELVHASPRQLAASRASAAGLDDSKDPARAPAKQYLMGMLALRAGDFRAAEAAVRALSELPEVPGSTIAADHALALRARILAARGDPAAALATFDQQKLRIPERYVLFYNRPREHFFRASLLAALGRPREALTLYQALGEFDPVTPVFYPAGQLRGARIHDSLGERERAIQGYERFVAMWHGADSEEEPEVRAARERLATLRNSR